MLARPNETTGSGIAYAEPDDGAQTAERLAAFGRASRHSRNVRFFKFAVPLVAVAIAIAFPAYSYLSAPPSVAVQTDGTAFSNGKLVMANPKLDGFTKQNLPYTMTAVRAVQDVEKQGVITLEGIAAKMPITDGNEVSLSARDGVYDSGKNTLTLNGNVALKTTDGVVAKLNSVYLDIAKGDMTTRDPVDISQNGSRITSDSMTVQDNGKVLVFEKRVRVNIDPAKMKSAENESGDKNAAQ